MKFAVTSRVASGNADTPLSELQAITKDVKLVNSKATLLNLRAVIAFKFRIALYSFAILYHGSRSGVDLSNEKKTLTECGLQEGDALLLWSKRARLEDAPVVRVTAPSPNAPVTLCGAPVSKMSRVDVSEGVIDASLSDSAIAVAAEGSAVGENSTPCAPLCSSSSTSTGALDGGTGLGNEATAASQESMHAPTAHESPTSALGREPYLDEVANDDDEPKDEDEEDQMGTVTNEEADEAAGGGPEKLYERLIEVVPDLVEMRQQFLADPQAILQRIEQSDARLFSLITANQEAFLELVNNEETVRLLQVEKDDTWDDDDDDDEDEYSEVELDEEGMEFGENMNDDDDDDEGEEISEATMQAISSIFMRRLNAAMAGQVGTAGDNNVIDSGDDNDNDTHDNSTNTVHTYSGSVPLNNREAILAHVPSVEDDRKIEELTQLGFSHEQAKIAFYMCRRSLDRAANYLFETPPQL